MEHNEDTIFLINQIINYLDINSLDIFSIYDKIIIVLSSLEINQHMFIDKYSEINDYDKNTELHEMLDELYYNYIPYDISNKYVINRVSQLTIRLKVIKETIDKINFNI